MIHRFLMLALPACCMLLLAGCDREPSSDPLADGKLLADQLQAGYHTSESFDAEIRIQVKPAEGDHTSFQLQIEGHPDVGVVLDGFEKGVEIFDGQLTASNDLTLILTTKRITGQQEVVAGNLDQAAKSLDATVTSLPVGLFVTRLHTIIDEVRSGPVPQAKQYQITKDDQGRTRLHCKDAHIETWCTLDEANQRVLEKTIYLHQDGGLKPIVSLSYHRHLVMDNLLRARDIRLSFPEDPTAIRIKLASLDVVRLKDKPRVPSIPDDLPQAELDAWLQTLIAPAAPSETPTP